MSPSQWKLMAALTGLVLLVVLVTILSKGLHGCPSFGGGEEVLVGVDGSPLMSLNDFQKAGNVWHKLGLGIDATP